MGLLHTTHTKHIDYTDGAGAGTGAGADFSLHTKHIDYTAEFPTDTRPEDPTRPDQQRSKLESKHASGD